MRRLSDRARVEGAIALRKALDGVRRGSQAVAPRSEIRLDERPSHKVAPVGTQDLELAKALNRISDSIERIGAQLDSYHLERAEHLDAIEFLLREMVISTVPATANRSSIFGGVVESERRDRDEIAIVPDGFPLASGIAVEVRSRFHDRWISGFSIAEAVDTPGRCRYRLTRLSDGIPLPILFEACDVRAASHGPERSVAAVASRSPLNESRIRS
jgi:hypothetical protein